MQRAHTMSLSVGELRADARQAVAHADRSGDAFQRTSKRTTAADALHQAGRRSEAGALFAEAERMQKDRQPQFDLLYSVPPSTELGRQEAAWWESARTRAPAVPTLS